MKLYRFSYSPYARKVEMLLALLGRSYERVEVSYSDRSELARVTGGYIYVPVWVSDGQVTVESRRICERLLAKTRATRSRRRPSRARSGPTPTSVTGRSKTCCSASPRRSCASARPTRASKPCSR